MSRETRVPCGSGKGEPKNNTRGPLPPVLDVALIREDVARAVQCLAPPEYVSRLRVGTCITAGDASAEHALHLPSMP